jgi:hypothetical protein
MSNETNERGAVHGHNRPVNGQNFRPLKINFKHNAYYQKNIDAEYSRSSSCDQTKWITNKSSRHAIQLG